MLLLDQIAERRIIEAIERGELDDLPGKGEPIVLDDDSMVPEPLRVACRILKNAGFLPAEIGLRREIRDVEQLLEETVNHDSRRTLGRRLRYLLTRLDLEHGGGALAYRDRLAVRFDGQ